MEYAFERNKLMDWTSNPFGMILQIQPDKMGQLNPERVLRSLKGYFCAPTDPVMGNNYRGAEFEQYREIAVYPALIELMRWHRDGINTFPYQNIHAFCDYKE